MQNVLNNYIDRKYSIDTNFLKVMLLIQKSRVTNFLFNSYINCFDYGLYVCKFLQAHHKNTEEPNCFLNKSS